MKQLWDGQRKWENIQAKKSRLKWYGHPLRIDEEYVGKRATVMERCREKEGEEDRSGGVWITSRTACRRERGGRTRSRSIPSCLRMADVQWEEWRNMLVNEWCAGEEKEEQRTVHWCFEEVGNALSKAEHKSSLDNPTQFTHIDHTQGTIIVCT